MEQATTATDGASVASDVENVTLTGVDRALVNELFDRFLAWKDSCAAVAERYAGWKGAPFGHSESAFAEYAAALDEEERACESYVAVRERALAEARMSYVSRTLLHQRERVRRRAERAQRERQRRVFERGLLAN